MKLDATNKLLGSFALWAIGVGMVISGESFGWNYGWAAVGPLGLLCVTLVVALMYFSLVKTKIELGCVYPDADGPQSYAFLAYGERFYKLVVAAILVEFVFIIPAVANSIGGYLSFLTNHTLDTKTIAACIIVFCSVSNFFNVKASLLFVYFLTFLAIGELGIFFISVIDGFSFDHLLHSGRNKFDTLSLVNAVPFGLWMLLGIEGLSLLTKSIKPKNFQKKLTKGYMLSFWTLFLLAVTVLVLAGGAKAWTDENWQAMTTGNDFPLPFLMKMVLGESSTVVRLFTFLGLCGLLASIYSIAVATLGQLELFIQGIPKIGRQAKTKKIMASLILLLVSLVSIYQDMTANLITIAAFGAVVMYFCVGISMLRLRQKRPKGYQLKGITHTHADFNGFSSRFWALVLVVLSGLFLAAISYLYATFALIFFALVIVYTVLPWGTKHH